LKEGITPAWKPSTVKASGLRIDSLVYSSGERSVLLAA
jgi:hypothetical protein